MGRRLILDTGVLIAFERGDIDRFAFEDDDLAIAALSVAEYRVGIELADSPRRASERAGALEAISRVIRVLDYRESTASAHARLIGHTIRAGSARGAHDLIIAAHAVETDRIVVTKDAKARFDELPGVEAMTPS